MTGSQKEATHSHNLLWTVCSNSFAFDSHWFLYSILSIPLLSWPLNPACQLGAHTCLPPPWGACIDSECGPHAWAPTTWPSRLFHSVESALSPTLILERMYLYVCITLRDRPLSRLPLLCWNCWRWLLVTILSGCRLNSGVMWGSYVRAAAKELFYWVGS